MPEGIRNCIIEDFLRMHKGTITIAKGLSSLFWRFYIAWQLRKGTYWLGK